MTRSRRISLGTPKTASPEPRAPAARYWRRWAYGGITLSVLLHLMIAGTAGIDLSEWRAQAEQPPIPVDVVDRTPEGAKLPPEPPRAEPKPPEPPKPPAPPERAPDPPKVTAAPSPPPAVPPAPALPAQPRAAAPNPAAWPTPQPPPEPPRWSALRPPPEPPPIPPAPRARAGPGGETPLAPDAVPPPSDKKALAYWVLDPLVIRKNDPCGAAHISAVMELTEEIAPGRYRGVLRRAIRWDQCPPVAGLYHVELLISGGEAHMRIDEGFADRGVIRGNVMMLEDALGRSVWRKR